MLLQGGKIQPGHQRALALQGVHGVVQAVFGGGKSKGIGAALWAQGPQRLPTGGPAAQGAAGHGRFWRALPQRKQGQRRGQAKGACQHGQRPAK